MTLAVIINVETKYVSSLALLSAVRHINLPVLLIDCESQDGSFNWFCSLQRKHPFRLITAPRRPHGAVLDWIFQTVEADGIIRETLAAGASFMHRLVLNDFPQIPAIGRLLWHRFRIPGLRQIRLRSLDSFRCEYEGHKPSYVFFDTGAQIHQVLTQRGFLFGDVGPEIPYWSVRHLHGVTRDVIHGPTRDARSASAVEPIVLDKLKEYGICGIHAATERGTYE